MTSIDQAFVKAYARRNQTDHKPQGAGTTADDGSPDDGSLHINHSAAGTASVWVDSAGGPRLRNDPPGGDTPKPHVDLAPQPDTASSKSPRVASATDESIAADKKPEGANPPLDVQPGARANSPAAVVSATPTTPQASEETFYAHATLAPELANLYAEPVPPPAPAPNARFAPAPPAPTESEETTDETNHVESSGTAASPFTAATVPGHSPQPTKASVAAGAAEKSVRDQTAPADVPSTVASGVQARAFRAVWEVDRFEMPEAVTSLFLNTTLFEQLGDQMSEASSNGLGSVLITSAKAGEGRSTTAVGTALAAAAAGLRVALIDADAQQPTLADDLRLDLEYGWLDALRGNLPLEEVSVYSIEDRLTLVPLMPPPGKTAATIGEIDDLVRQVRKKFDLVLLDGPFGPQSILSQSVTAIDTALIIRDVARTTAEEVNEMSQHLRASGVRGIGMIENFS